MHGVLRANKRWLPVVLWMGFIFVMSSDVGSDAHTSRILEPVILWISPNASPVEIQQAHFLIRKSGHLSEYAMLAFLLFRAIRRPLRPGSSPWSWQSAGIALLMAAAYAATDEWHQSFIPSRTADLHDVLIDSCGASIGLTLVFFCYKLTALRRAFQTKPSSSLPKA
jgi:VanZ family protein